MTQLHWKLAKEWCQLMLNHVVSNIHQFSSKYNIMRLKPKKCNRRYYPLKIVLTITKLNKMPL